MRDGGASARAIAYDAPDVRARRADLLGRLSRLESRSLEGATTPAGLAQTTIPAIGRGFLRPELSPGGRATPEGDLHYFSDQRDGHVGQESIPDDCGHNAQPDHRTWPTAVEIRRTTVKRSSYMG
jgi:hypothetical protein